MPAGVIQSSGRKDPCPLWSQVHHPWSRQPRYVCLCISELHTQGTRDGNCHWQITALESGCYGPKAPAWVGDENKQKIVVLAWTDRSVWLSWASGKRWLWKSPTEFRSLSQQLTVNLCWGWGSAEFPISQNVCQCKNEKAMMKNEWWEVRVCEKRRKDIDYSYSNKSVWNLSWYST